MINFQLEMDTGRILSWKGWNKCSSSFPLFSVSFSIQQIIFSVLHHFVNIKESTYPNLPFLGRWENLALRAHPEVTGHPLISSCSPVAAVLTSSPAQSSLPARFRPSGVNMPSDIANNTSNPLLIFRCFYFCLWRETESDFSPGHVLALLALCRAVLATSSPHP